MNHSIYARKAKSVAADPQRGFTLIELIVATAIMVILLGAAFPLARSAVQREREHELRQDLWMIRDAIDRYKDAADRQAPTLFGIDATHAVATIIQERISSSRIPSICLAINAANRRAQ